ncbi:acetyl-CoA carboxylase biotin carboxyl carrier protein [Desmospora profundinema]|uniref:Biotin carboxyl carrier protein of acetyl-CoA carboxylase n=1 Tax=Desmospora profundinema TaxID=1571184 RepID=A0ABU1IL29_9BACL|nr:acetyl-CoA carboxylase biotin carboxyl carrier protein [Desmospora profundinema]MDR6224654.1 acetyl-CoA carboxylase biotin carboxyl carrier protein [Desmospora profundinema]
MKMHEIRELIRLVDESEIDEFELDNDGTKIVIKKKVGERRAVAAPQVVEERPAVSEPAAQPVAAPTASVPAPAKEAPAPDAVEAEDESGLHQIVSPMVGTFYRAPSPDSDPYVDKGSQVNEKTIVCIVEAMKLMNEIEAEVKGDIVKVLAENGQLVEYGQPLFLVKPE